MENATKALMIAGAVLLAIMIIGVGMMIFNNANNVIGGVSGKMDQQAIDMFNDQFVRYEGTQSGSQVKALISTVITNNSTESEDNGGAGHIVTFDGKSSSADLSSARSAVVSGKKYTISFEYGADGLISAITKADAGSGSSNQ